MQAAPPTSACSTAFGDGIGEMVPGTQRGIQVVGSSASAAYDELVERGVDASPVQTMPWGSFTSFADPDGNRWSVQQLPDRSTDSS